jgi:RNA polymerase sigma-70 factor (ECF subfamily)
MPSRAELPETDDALLIRARNGDREAFGELVERHQRRVWRVCRQYLGPADAGAAAQDALVKAYLTLLRRPFGLHLGDADRVNTCLDELRRRRREGLRRRRQDAADPDPLATLPDSAAGRAVDQRRPWRLKRSSWNCPSASARFSARFYAELELDEIAGALGVRGHREDAAAPGGAPARRSGAFDDQPS